MFPMIGKDRGPGGSFLEDFEVKFEMRTLIVANTKEINSKSERQSMVIGFFSDAILSEEGIEAVIATSFHFFYLDFRP